MSNFSLMIDVISSDKDGVKADVSYEDKDGNNFESSVSGTDLDEVFVDLYADVVESIAELSRKPKEKDPVDMTDAEYIAYLENEIIKLKKKQDEKQKKEEISKEQFLNDFNKIFSNYNRDALLNYYKKNPLFKYAFSW